MGFWDPLGLSADGDTEVFKRRNSAEGETGCLPLLFCTYIVFEHYVLGCPRNSHHHDSSIFNRGSLWTLICDCYWAGGQPKLYPLRYNILKKF